MDLQGDMPITLVIKAPNQRMEDQTVDCMLGWTIRKLKYHLERVYPSKPKLHEQRLIYSGKLLQDHLTLKEILKQFDQENSTNTHTVHLVCSASTSTPSTSSTSSSTSQRPPRESTASSQPTASNPVPNREPEVPSTSSSNVPPSQNASLRHRGSNLWRNRDFSYLYQNVPASQNFLTDPAVPTNQGMAPAGYAYTPEQYAWMVQHQQQLQQQMQERHQQMQQQHQLYNQYMMQYMQYYQNMHIANLPFVAGGVIPNLNPLNMPAPAAAPPPPPQQQQQQQQAGPQQPAAPAANNNNDQRGNVRMNAQGGMEEDDEDERDPRDWLHHTYFIMRFITFVGIIVFYSSFSRFVMVTAGFLVIYILQKMRVARQYVRRQQQQQEQQQREEEERQRQEQQEQQPGQEQGGNDVPEQQQEAEAQPPQENNVSGENSNEESNSNPEQSGEQSAQEVPQEEEGNRVVRSLYFILKTVETFFSSLVPAPPELMEAN